MTALGLEHDSFSSQGVPPPGRGASMPIVFAAGLGSEWRRWEHHKWGLPAFGCAGEQSGLIAQQLHGKPALIRPMATAFRMHRTDQAFWNVLGKLLPTPDSHDPPPGHLHWAVTVQPAGPQCQWPWDCWKTFGVLSRPEPRTNQPPLKLLDHLQRQSPERCVAKSLPQAATPKPDPWRGALEDLPTPAKKKFDTYSQGTDSYISSDSRVATCRGLTLLQISQPLINLSSPAVTSAWRIRASPTSTASAPAFWTRSRSSRLNNPDSLTSRAPLARI